MNLSSIDLVLISIDALAFGYFGLAWFFSPLVKAEFIRLRINRLGGFVAGIEVAGALGAFLEIWSKGLLLFSCSGLTILMLLGLFVRARTEDKWYRYLPALALLFLNLVIVIRVLEQA